MMPERDQRIAAMLMDVTPAPENEHGDWQQVVADAMPSRILGRSLADHIFIAPIGVRRAIVAAAIVALVAVIPALAVSQDWWFFGSDPPRATGEVVTVEAVQASTGSSWVLTAYVSEDAGICVALSPSNGSSSGAALNCGAGVAGEPNLPSREARHAVGVVVTRGAETPSFLFGITASDVARVDVSLRHGGVVSGRTISAPEGLGVRNRFYVIELPPQAAVTEVSAKDEAGTVMERRVVPSPPE